MLAVLVLFVVGIIFLDQIEAEQKEINKRNTEELEEAVRQKQEKENYVKECVQGELDTTSEVTLTRFKVEESENGSITHYVAEVNGAFYLVDEVYTDRVYFVDLIKEI